MSTQISKPLTDSQIINALLPYEIYPNEGQIANIRDYIAVLLRWNRSVSLTSIIDPSEIVGRHFGESMYVSKILPVEKCRLVDIGTGAGFPGLALKILSPGVSVDLVESNGKKCAFLSEVIRVLGMDDVQVRAERYESIRPEDIRADVITSRAVGDFKSILRWSSAALSSEGHLVLWVGAEDSLHIMQKSDWTWQPPRRLPDSQRRFILIGRRSNMRPQ